MIARAVKKREKEEYLHFATVTDQMTNKKYEQCIRTIDAYTDKISNPEKIYLNAKNRAECLLKSNLYVHALTSYNKLSQRTESCHIEERVACLMALNKPAEAADLLEEVLKQWKTNWKYKEPVYDWQMNYLRAECWHVMNAKHGVQLELYKATLADITDPVRCEIALARISTLEEEQKQTDIVIDKKRKADSELVNDPKRKKQNDDDKLCVVCLDEVKSVTFHPCIHMNCCTGCAQKVEKCPECNAAVRLS